MLPSTMNKLGGARSRSALNACWFRWPLRERGRTCVAIERFSVRQDSLHRRAAQGEADGGRGEKRERNQDTPQPIAQ
jgi:hypothetical protein